MRGLQYSYVLCEIYAKMHAHNYEEKCLFVLIDIVEKM